MGFGNGAGKYIGRMFRALITGLAQRIPSQCAVCGSWPAQPACEACVAQFAQPVSRCPTCARSVPAGMVRCGRCMLEPGALDAALAAVSYAYPWSQWVVSFKFYGQTAKARTMAQLLRSTPWVEPALEKADCVVPMPLSPQRLAQRGFNQTLLLARELGTAKVQAQVLLRIQDTPPQSALARKERLQSVRHAYAVDPLQQAAVQGKRIVLVDDVMTTGASIQAAAGALRQAGALHITGLVFARAES